MRKDPWFLVGAVIAAVFVLLVLIATEIQATPNLPLSCKAALGSDKKCAEANYQYVPGKSGLLIATPSGVWSPWETLSASDDVRVCPRDITPGTACPVNRITVDKSLAAVEIPAPANVRITYRWDAVTLDDKGALLPPGEIVGYQLTWWMHTTPSQMQTINTGNVTSFTLTAPQGVVCAALVAEGKSAVSDSTSNLCLDPVAKVIKPASPVGFKGEAVE